VTAAHFAAALAIKSHVPETPTAALIIGAFIPDFLWIALATGGIETTKRELFFDDWSHSLLSIIVFATVYAFFFRNRGPRVARAAWLAVFSHFLLDLPVHPKDLALYPHSSIHLGLGLSGIPSIDYWFIQLAAVVLLLAVYAISTRRLNVRSDAIIASCVLVLGWHVVLMPG
jgi:membrane-bound metal-dependent hydrolase YbcI (DUF457 family)